MLFISLELLVANALIEVMDRNKDRLEVQFDDIVRYGYKVSDIILRHTGEEVILLLSEKYQADLEENHNDIFIVKHRCPNCRAFALKEGVDADTLKSIYRWPLSHNILDALTAQETVDVLH